MNNCLGSIWHDIVAGSIRVFIATSRNERAAVSLRWCTDDVGWGVDQIAGPSNRMADARFTDFAQLLCESCAEE